MRDGCPAGSGAAGATGRVPGRRRISPTAAGAAPIMPSRGTPRWPDSHECGFAPTAANLAELTRAPVQNGCDRDENNSEVRGRSGGKKCTRRHRNGRLGGPPPTSPRRCWRGSSSRAPSSVVQQRLVSAMRQLPKHFGRGVPSLPKNGDGPGQRSQPGIGAQPPGTQRLPKIRGPSPVDVAPRTARHPAVMGVRSATFARPPMAGVAGGSIGRLLRRSAHAGCRHGPRAGRSR